MLFLVSLSNFTVNFLKAGNKIPTFLEITDYTKHTKHAVGHKYHFCLFILFEKLSKAYILTLFTQIKISKCSFSVVVSDGAQWRSS